VRDPSRRRAALAALLYLGLAFALYAPTLHARFEGDDFIWLYDAAHLTSPLDLFRIHHVGFAIDDGIRLSPLELSFFWIALRLGGVHPLVPSIMAIGLVALNAFLLHLWIREAGGGDLGAVAGALVFLLYPGHREPQGWLSAVNEPLVGCGSLICLIGFARFKREGTNGWRALSWMGLIGALLSKESAAILPLVLVVADVVLYAERPRVMIHLPYWTVLGAAIGWHVAATHAARGSMYTLQPPNEAIVAMSGTLRHMLGLVWGERNVAFLPPQADRPAAPEAWVALAVFGILYGCALGWALAEARERPGLRGGAFHLAWIPLAVLPYAVMVPHAELQTRYAWQGSMALAGLVGCAMPRRREAVVGLALLCAAEGWVLHGAVQRIVQPDDSAALVAQVAAATRELSPSGRIFVYQAPGEQHVAGRLCSLLSGVGAERVRDWYDAERELGDGDVMLFFDRGERTVTDLTRAVRSALGAPRHLPPDPRPTSAFGAPLLAEWRFRKGLGGWLLSGAREGAPGVFTVNRPGDALASPLLNYSPFDVYAVEVVYTPLQGDIVGPPLLGWSSPIEEGFGGRRVVTGVPGEGAAFFYPATRPAWWSEGGARRFFLLPSTRPAEIRIDAVKVYAPPQPAPLRERRRP
jgi:hypothetical protein